MEQKYIYMVRYTANLSYGKEVYKTFDTLEGAHEFHANYKENTAKVGYPGREIEHYEIVCVPHNIRSADEPGFYDNDASADTEIGFRPSTDAVHTDAVHTDAYEGVL